MKNIITMLAFIIGFAFAQEMEVDGALRVTGGINSEGQPITNVGPPQNPSDAATMSSVETIVNNMPGLGGTQPGRIYTKLTEGGETYTVPNDKIWQVLLNSDYCTAQYLFYHSVTITNGGSDEANLLLTSTRQHMSDSTREFWLYPGYTIRPNYGAQTSGSPPGNTEYQITIFEYPITSSGTDQGLDYVEP